MSAKHPLHHTAENAGTMLSAVIPTPLPPLSVFTKEVCARQVCVTIPPASLCECRWCVRVRVRR